MPHLLPSIHFGPQAAVFCDLTSIPKEPYRYQDSLSSSSSWVTSSPAQSSPWLMRLSHSITEALCSGPASLCPPQFELLQDVIWGTQIPPTHTHTQHLHLCFIYIPSERTSLQPSTQRGCAEQCRITSFSSPSLHEATDPDDQRVQLKVQFLSSSSCSCYTGNEPKTARRDLINVPSGNVGQAKQTDFREFKRPLASVAEGATDNNHNCQRRSYTGIEKATG